jgi:hypothetical protein
MGRPSWCRLVPFALLERYSRVQADLVGAPWCRPVRSQSRSLSCTQPPSLPAHSRGCSTTSTSPTPRTLATRSWSSRSGSPSSPSGSSTSTSPMPRCGSTCCCCATAALPVRGRRRGGCSPNAWAARSTPSTGACDLETAGLVRVEHCDLVLRWRGVRAFAVSGPSGLLPADAAQPLGTHQPFHGAPGHARALAEEFGVDLAGPGDPEVVLVHGRDLHGQLRVAHGTSRWDAVLGGVVGARGDRHACLTQDSADRLDPERAALDDAVAVGIDVVDDHRLDFRRWWARVGLE